MTTFLYWIIQEEGYIFFLIYKISLNKRIVIITNLV